MMTRYDAEVIVLSITQDNLKDNLWKELALWQGRSDLLTKAFRLSGERIIAKARERTWWVSARAFAQTADKEKQANTIAGFHGQNIMVVLDEVGDYPDGVVVAAEGIFANKDLNGEKKLVVAGNPTNTRGPLYRITYKDSKNWCLVRITGDPDDPHRSPRISLDWAVQMIDTWGRDNPWVRVNVLGLFPLAGSDQLIGEEDVRKAQTRDAKPNQYSKSARIWGLDPSGLGLGTESDEACLYKRQGINGAFPRPMVWKNKGGVQLAIAVATELAKAEEAGELPDTVFCDRGGQGASCLEHLQVLNWGHVVVGVDFAGDADDPERFLNKRAEIWWRMSDWIKSQPSCLPVDTVLASELPSPKFFFQATGKRTKFVLESKKDMKKRGVSSPNRADALALTFTSPVAPRSHQQLAEETGSARVRTEYNPLERADHSDHSGRMRTTYDPYNRSA
jgi:hypothetical protein